MIYTRTFKDRLGKEKKTRLQTQPPVNERKRLIRFRTVVSSFMGNPVKKRNKIFEF